MSRGHVVGGQQVGDGEARQWVINRLGNDDTARESPAQGSQHASVVHEELKTER